MSLSDAPCRAMYVARYARNLCGCRFNPSSRGSLATISLSILRMVQVHTLPYTPPVFLKLINKASLVSGSARRTIQDLEARGDGRVSTAIKLADALGVTLDELCRDEAAE